MANVTGGTFCYAASPEAIPAAVGTIVGALKSCVGVNVELKMTEAAPPAAAAAADVASPIAAAVTASQPPGNMTPYPRISRLLCSEQVRVRACRIPLAAT